MHKLSAILSCAALVALRSSAVAKPPPPTATLHTCTSPESGIFANAYILETPRSAIVIDATLTVSDGKRLRAQVDALGKPLAAVFITHGHPDHYNGLTELLAGRPPVPVYATVGVDRVIREWDARKEAQWKPVFKEEWPEKRTFPDHPVRDGETVTVDGIRFTAHDLGPGESHADAYWLATGGGKTWAFVGDLVFNGEHSYVSDGHTAQWLANLKRVRGPLRGLRLYPGHGAPGGAELLDAERRYLEKLRAEVARLAQGRAALTEPEKAELVKSMSAYLPGGKLTFLISVGADAVAAELARR